MTAKILAAAPLVEKIKTDLRSRCESLKKRGIIPSMSVILVGNNPASLTYIRNKKKVCEEVGAKFSLVQLPASISVEDFQKEIQKINHDPAIHGLIIQLPVSDHLRKLNLANLVVPKKDIDGFHGENTQAIYSGTTDLKLLLPCTPKGIVHLLKHYGVEIAGKNITIIGRSLIVGKPLSMLLSNLNATVTLAHSHSQNLSDLTKNSDIIISAVGKAHFINASFINPTKKTVVVDVGMNTIDGKLVGDVNPNVATVAGALTPVPGGVGPMTVVTLIENLISAAENQSKG